MKTYKIIFISFATLFLVIGIYLDFYVKPHSIYWTIVRTVCVLSIVIGAIMLRTQFKKHNVDL